jgi:sulfide dehydrogenase cytochrome subunit
MLFRLEGWMISKRQVLGFASGAALLLLAGTAHAQSAADTAVLAAQCANCHGTDGKSNGRIPTLAGRPAPSIVALMKAYKGETPVPGTTIMNRLAKGYSDEQIEALAKFFSEKK